MRRRMDAEHGPSPRKHGNLAEAEVHAEKFHRAREVGRFRGGQGRGRDPPVRTAKTAA